MGKLNKSQVVAIGVTTLVLGSLCSIFGPVNHDIVQYGSGKLTFAEFMGRSLIVSGGLISLGGYILGIRESGLRRPKAGVGMLVLGFIGFILSEFARVPGITDISIALLAIGLPTAIVQGINAVLRRNH